MYTNFSFQSRPDGTGGILTWSLHSGRFRGVANMVSPACRAETRTPECPVLARARSLSFALALCLRQFGMQTSQSQRQSNSALFFPPTSFATEH